MWRAGGLSSSITQGQEFDTQILRHTYQVDAYACRLHADTRKEDAVAQGASAGEGFGGTVHGVYRPIQVKAYDCWGAFLSLNVG